MVIVVPKLADSLAGRMELIRLHPLFQDELAGKASRFIEVAFAFQLSRPTMRDYVVLLEKIFMLEHLPPWFSNRISRLIKTPKLHLADTGLAASLLGMDAAAIYKDRAIFGQLLETFVFQELKRQASLNDRPVRFHHFRNMERIPLALVRTCMLSPFVRSGKQCRQNENDFELLHVEKPLLD